jgi:hypothetical protein
MSNARELCIVCHQHDAIEFRLCLACLRQASWLLDPPWDRR